MRSKKRTAAAGTSSNSTHNPTLLFDQTQLCLEGESLACFLKSIQREIESSRALDSTLPRKFWIKQQFAVGVNEVTRVLERIPPYRGTTISPEEERFPANGEAQTVSLQAILVASDCNPRWMIKHLPALAASRDVPLIFVKDRKEGSLRLGELIKLKTAIAIGIKAKRNSVNQVIKEVLNNDKIHSIEA